MCMYSAGVCFRMPAAGDADAVHVLLSCMSDLRCSVAPWEIEACTGCMYEQGKVNYRALAVVYGKSLT